MGVCLPIAIRSTRRRKESFLVAFANIVRVSSSTNGVPIFLHFNCLLQFLEVLLDVHVGTNAQHAREKRFGHNEDPRSPPTVLHFLLVCRHDGPSYESCGVDASSRIGI